MIFHHPQVSQYVYFAKFKAIRSTSRQVAATKNPFHFRLLHASPGGLEHFASAGHIENVSIWSSIQNRFELKDHLPRALSLWLLEPLCHCT